MRRETRDVGEKVAIVTGQNISGCEEQGTSDISCRRCQRYWEGLLYQTGALMVLGDIKASAREQLAAELGQ